MGGIRKQIRQTESLPASKKTDVHDLPLSQADFLEALGRCKPSPVIPPSTYAIWNDKYGAN
jgi:hypothetical protein